MTKPLPNLEGYTPTQLQEIIATAQGLLTAETDKANKEIEAVLAKYGMSKDTLAPRKGYKYKIKYRHPTDPKKTWTGRYTNAPIKWLVDEASAKGENTSGWTKGDWIAFADLHFSVAAPEPPEQPKREVLTGEIPDRKAA